jgi:hypothetical protein
MARIVFFPPAVVIGNDGQFFMFFCDDVREATLSRQFRSRSGTNE